MQLCQKACPYCTVHSIRMWSRYVFRGCQSSPFWMIWSHPFQLMCCQRSCNLIRCMGFINKHVMGCCEISSSRKIRRRIVFRVNFLQCNGSLYIYTHRYLSFHPYAQISDEVGGGRAGYLLSYFTHVRPYHRWIKLQLIIPDIFHCKLAATQ